MGAAITNLSFNSNVVTCCNLRTHIDISNTNYQISRKRWSEPTWDLIRMWPTQHMYRHSQRPSSNISIGVAIANLSSDSKVANPCNSSTCIDKTNLHPQIFDRGGHSQFEFWFQCEPTVQFVDTSSHIQRGMSNCSIGVDIANSICDSSFGFG